MRKDSVCGMVLLAAAASWAQAPFQQGQTPQALPSQAPVLHGVFLEGDARVEGVESGEFCVRGPGDEVIRYRFDAKTRVEREGLATTLPLLRPGERVEVSSDAIPDSPLRYARSILAIDPLPAVRITPRPRTRAVPTALQPLLPHGELTFSGVVSYLADGRLILRTRNSGEQTILLRQDTRYLAGGDIVRGSDLKANMRVFVRAGKDLFGHTEAYQVMWGGFLQPYVP